MWTNCQSFVPQPGCVGCKERVSFLYFINPVKIKKNATFYIFCALSLSDMITQVRSLVNRMKTDKVRLTNLSSCSHARFLWTESFWGFFLASTACQLQRRLESDHHVYWWQRHLWLLHRHCEQLSSLLGLLPSNRLSGASQTLFFLFFFPPDIFLTEKHSPSNPGGPGLPPQGGVFSSFLPTVDHDHTDIWTSVPPPPPLPTLCCSGPSCRRQPRRDVEHCATARPAQWQRSGLPHMVCEVSRHRGLAEGQWKWFFLISFKCTLISFVAFFFFFLCPVLFARACWSLNMEALNSSSSSSSTRPIR